jgi:hypothetical protein
VRLAAPQKPDLVSPAAAAGDRRGFTHSVLSYTRMDVPTLEVFETAVTFNAPGDPVSAHAALAEVFGQDAGFGRFLFRPDSTIQGRYWVQSLEPWTRWPATAASALEPKRLNIQLAEALMYRFTLRVSAGHEQADGEQKIVKPFSTTAEFEQWFNDNSPAFGLKPLMLNVSLQTLSFGHGGQRYRIPHAVIEGALEVTNAERLRRRIVKGFGSFKRVGLGMLQLTL